MMSTYTARYTKISSGSLGQVVYDKAHAIRLLWSESIDSGW